jgi:hypothetical protein
VFYITELIKKLSLNVVFVRQFLHAFLADGVFEIAITVAVQNVFCLEIHQDDVFLFF